VLRAGIQGGEHTWYAAARHDLRLLEARIQRELPHVLRALRRVDSHVRDRGQRDPVAQSLDGGGLVGGDRRHHLVAIGAARCRHRRIECKEQRGQAAEKQVPVESHRAAVRIKGDAARLYWSAHEVQPRRATPPVGRAFLRRSG